MIINNTCLFVDDDCVKDINGNKLDINDIKTKGVTAQTFTLADAGNIEFHAGNSIANLSYDEAYEDVQPVRTAVDRTAEMVNRAKLRVFTKSGDEVVSGDLYDYVNQHAYEMKQVATINYILKGTAAFWTEPVNGRPTTFRVLNPSKLQMVPNPSQIEWVDEITGYIYNKTGTGKVNLLPEEVVIAQRYDTNSVMGESYFKSVRTQINAYFIIQKWLNDYFSNDATPAKIMSFTNKLNKEQHEAFDEKMKARFGHYGGNKGKILTVFGGEVKTQNLSDPIEDIPIDGLLSTLADQIIAVVGVPPIVAGFYNKTRFDSAAEELIHFAENIVSPIIDSLNQVYQTQIADRYTWRKSTIRTQKVTSKALSTKITKLVESGAIKGDFIILIDTDSLPIAFSAKKTLYEIGGDLIEKWGMTRNQVSEYLGLDLPKEGGDEPKDEKPKEDKSILEADNKLNDSLLVLFQEDEEEELNEEEKSSVNSLSKCYFELRKFILKEESLKLRDLDSIVKQNCDDKYIEVVTNDVRLLVGEIKDGANVKETFNQRNKTFFKMLVRGQK